VLETPGLRHGERLYLFQQSGNAVTVPLRLVVWKSGIPTHHLDCAR
jgi:hypothetical protein